MSEQNNQQQPAPEACSVKCPTCSQECVASLHTGGYHTCPKGHTWKK